MSIALAQLRDYLQIVLNAPLNSCFIVNGPRHIKEIEDKCIWVHDLGCISIVPM